MQNGLPFHLANLNPTIAKGALKAVDPDGALLAAFSKNQVTAGVTYVASKRTGHGEVTLYNSKSVTMF